MESTIEMLAYGMLISGVIIFVAFISGLKATYGRYSHQSHLPVFFSCCYDSGSDSEQNNRNNVKRYFSMARGYTAKWAWFVQEIPSLYIPLYYLVTNITSLPFINAFVLVLFCLHYVNRALIYPLLIKSGTGTPVHVFLLAFLFCTVNGYMQGAWHSHYVIYNKSLKNITFCFIGLVVYVIGMIINILSDSILRDLRKDGKPGYRIPYGGLFTYVSGANFFGECVEWIGYALLTRTLPACAFAFFTLCNLAPRAYHHHRWYLKKFDEYPKNRKAFIPFVI